MPLMMCDAVAPLDRRGMLNIQHPCDLWALVACDLFILCHGSSPAGFGVHPPSIFIAGGFSRVLYNTSCCQHKQMHHRCRTTIKIHGDPWLWRRFEWELPSLVLEPDLACEPTNQEPGEDPASVLLLTSGRSTNTMEGPCWSEAARKVGRAWIGFGKTVASDTSILRFLSTFQAPTWLTLRLMLPLFRQRLEYPCNLEPCQAQATKVSSRRCPIWGCQWDLTRCRLLHLWRCLPRAHPVEMVPLVNETFVHFNIAAAWPYHLWPMSIEYYVYIYI